MSRASSVPPIDGGYKVPMRIPESKLQVVVAEKTCAPRNEDTLRILALIGKPLTRVEISDTGEMYFEFGEFGCIVTRPKFGLETLVQASREVTA